jgi:SNF2 family DNA or RNA helicase
LIGWGVLLGTKWDLVIADESHRIKSPNSKASWFAYQFTAKRRAKKRLALTGTPMPHSPLDIYAQFRFLDPSIFNTNYHRFKMRYAKIIDLGDFKKIVGFQNLPELNQRFYTRAHRVLKSDVLDLPPVVHVKSFCELDRKALKVYAMLKTAFVAWLDSGEQITASNILTKLLRLSQLTGGYFQADGAEKGVHIDHAKIDLLEDLLLGLPDKEPAVVFCRFRPEIERVKQLCEKLERHCAELSGAMNQLKEWQKGQYDVIVVQIRSGGLGVDLTRSCYGFYFSTGYSLGDFDQSLARLDRPGQTRKVTYHHLLAENTIDIDIYQSLEEKRDVVDSVLRAVGRGGAFQPQPLKEVG